MTFSVKLLLVCLLLSPSSGIQQCSVDTDGHLTPQIFRRGHSSVFFCCTAITGSREDTRSRFIIRLGLLSAPCLFGFFKLRSFLTLKNIAASMLPISIGLSFHPSMTPTIQVFWWLRIHLDLMQLRSWIWPSRFLTFFQASITFKISLGQFFLFGFVDSGKTSDYGSIMWPSDHVCHDNWQTWL